MSLSRNLMIGVACLIGGVAAASESPVQNIGIVFQPEFNGALGRLDKNERQLLYTNPVYANELVHTGKDSSTALQFIDKTRIQVGASSDVVLDRYVFDPNSGIGSVAVNFSSGVFRFVTGQMKNKDGYDLRTPSGVMAIRGTKLIIFVDSKGNTTTFVEEGEIVARSLPLCQPPQEVLVRAGQSVKIPIDCGNLSVVAGNLTPPDSAVVTDLPVPQDLAAAIELLGNLEPGAGPPEDNNGPPPPERGYRGSASPF